MATFTKWHNIQFIAWTRAWREFPWESASFSPLRLWELSFNFSFSSWSTRFTERKHSSWSARIKGRNSRSLLEAWDWKKEVLVPASFHETVKKKFNLIILFPYRFLVRACIGHHWTKSSTIAFTCQIGHNNPWCPCRQASLSPPVHQHCFNKKPWKLAHLSKRWTLKRKCKIDQEQIGI